LKNQLKFDIAKKYYFIIFRVVLKIDVLQSISVSRNIKFRQCAIAMPPRTPCAAAKLRNDMKKLKGRKERRKKKKRKKNGMKKVYGSK
jgi:hypothetical protein